MWLSVGVLCGACATTGAETPPEAPAERLDLAVVTRDLTARYAALTSYQDTGTEKMFPGVGRMAMGGGTVSVETEPQFEGKFRTWYGAPNRFRFEWEGSDKDSGFTMASDGQRNVICSRKTCECEAFKSLDEAIRRASDLGGDNADLVPSLSGLLANRGHFGQLVNLFAKHVGEDVKIQGMDLGKTEKPRVLILNPAGLVSRQSRGPAKVTREFLADMDQDLQATFPDPNTRHLAVATMQMILSSVSVDFYEKIQTNAAIPDEVFAMPTLDPSMCTKKAR